MKPTTRLSFIPVSLEWVDAIYNANTGAVKDYFYDFPTRDAVAEWVATAIDEMAQGKEEYVIINKLNEHGLTEFVGMISPRINEDGTADIGMWIKTDAQRKGFGGEALTATLAHLKAKGVTTVVYEAEEGNTASISLVESLGATPHAHNDNKYKKFLFDLVTPV